MPFREEAVNPSDLFRDALTPSACFVPEDTPSSPPRRRPSVPVLPQAVCERLVTQPVLPLEQQGS